MLEAASGLDLTPLARVVYELENHDGRSYWTTSSIFAGRTVRIRRRYSSVNRRNADEALARIELTGVHDAEESMPICSIEIPIQPLKNLGKSKSETLWTE